MPSNGFTLQFWKNVLKNVAETSSVDKMKRAKGKVILKLDLVEVI